MAGTTIAFLILVPTVGVATFLFWNAAAVHGRGIADDREALGFVVVAIAIAVAAGLLALLG